ncbi:MAG TPA: GGDEF domain-containing protein [Nordella sp.]|nr:GGDEF domain-containing protein [Nordella sp.]
MDPSTVFITISLLMFANGGVLGLIHRDLPATLRPAAKSWQTGTLLIALGCTIFAFPTVFPMPATVVMANGLFLLGLTAYLRSLQKFYGTRHKLLHILPTVIAVLGVFWFSAFDPNTEIRILIVAVAWLWLMFASVMILANTLHPDWALSRKMLLSIFVAVLAFTVARAFYYMQLRIAPDFSITGNGHWLNLATPVFMTVLPVIGTTAFALMCSDRIRRQWEHAASTDYLTGLPNRRTLSEVGNERFARAAAQGAGFAVAVIDIDAFKAINDAYGHEDGDKALIHVAFRLQVETRKGDFVARSGGEEFVVLLNDPDPAGPQAAAERLRLAVEQDTFSIGDETVPLTVSVGLALHQPEDRNFADTLRRADKALYLAKTLGRNRVELAA